MKDKPLSEKVWTAKQYKSFTNRKICDVLYAKDVKEAISKLKEDEHINSDGECAKRIDKIFGRFE